jgi:hypothetical protein
MSLLGRLFGGGTPPPPPTSVVIDPELAATLTAGGDPLDRAVDAALRAHLESLRRPEPVEPREPERVPFWLQRDDQRDQGLEDELRDRIIHRRESESESRQ